MKNIMKNIFRIITVAAAFASLVACEKYADYKYFPYASLDVRSATIEESSPATTWSLPVHVYNTNGDCTVSYTIEPIEAQEGVDFTISDASGVLNFPAGTDTQNITFSITGQPGTFTGNVRFRVKLAGATNDVNLGAINTCTVTIKDLDHPLSALFGDYTFSSVFNVDGGFSYGSWEMSISPYEGSVTRVVIDKVTMFQSASLYGSYLPHGEVYGIVSDDRQTITIPVPQQMESTAADAFGVDENFVLYKYAGNTIDSGFETADGVITFTLQEDGSWRTYDSYGLATESYVGEGWFWYYMNCFGSFNSNYPTKFVKN